MSQPSVAQAIDEGAARLASISDTPRLEARVLLAHSQGLHRDDLIRDPARLIDSAAYQALLGRRLAREPLALIIGRREFWSMDFRVSSATLIPRPDSEALVEAAVGAFSGRPPPHAILDLGTGTGCLLLALLTEFPSAFGIGLDRSRAAAVLAFENARQLGLAARSAFVVGDWTAPLACRFDLIVSNPPYIRSGDIPNLMPEVAAHEPASALDGGVDGYDAYRTIIAQLPAYLPPEGVAVLELGHGQTKYVEELARDRGLVASLRLDLAEIPRAIVLTWPDR
jgi:release factor glutamine methyltransferase